MIKRKESAMDSARVSENRTAVDWRWRRLDWERLVLWIVLGIGSVAMIGPFYWMIISSFKTQREGTAIPPTWWPQEFTLKNWQDIGNLTTGSMLIFFRNSAFVVIVITLITLFTSSIAGYVFAKFEFRFKNVIFWLVISMLVVPFSVTLIPLFNMVADWGWRNNYLALIVPILFTPFGIFLMRQQIANIPNELIDAARIDGASELGIYLRVILPLSGAALAALAIFTFTFQWDNFLWPLVVLDDPGLYTLPLGLAQFRGRGTVDMGLVSAASFVAVLPVLIVYVLAQRRFIEGITLTGMK
ncbi:MAG: carbohydrate ABC transporter permease [Anaerolineae bacterium]|uniref:carbohydrate ABC transporter permease n=1 Tax=Candidatus Flexifilum breve TaxID=3140694 RepID=UPI001AD36B8F|nr:carbohydrate ABC transporter permease [Chloroflexota bacterium]MBN8635707.1 carbohydrate ABC transporter permease [Anaerolineae bacterium]